MTKLNYLRSLLFLIVLLLLSPSKPTFADTAISAGSISGIWNLAGSPYIVAGSVQIESGESLTIEAGVVVKFEADAGLVSAGTLTAIGTEALPILFISTQASPSSGYWTGLELNQGSSNSELNNAEVAYAVDGITCYESSPNIIDCAVQHNSNDGIVVRAYASGCNGGTALPTISGCTINNNSRYGVRYSGSASSSSGCTSHRTGHAGGDLIDNLIQSNGSHGVYAHANTGWVGVDGKADPTIQENQILSNTGSGVFLFNSSINVNFQHMSPVIENNQITGNGSSGIYSTARSGLITIVGNTLSDNTERGIYHQVSSSNPYETIHVMGNTITGNSMNGVETMQVATFKDNTLYDNSPYDFNYLDSIEQVAFLNDWGTESVTEIDAHIYDYLDDANLGIVTYNENVPPAVLWTIPIDGTPHVTTNANIIVMLEEAYGLNENSVNDETFLVSDGENPIAGVISLEGTKVVFDPNAPLSLNRLYTVTITTGIMDIAGNNLSEDYVFSFQTSRCDYFGTVVNSISSPGEKPRGLAFNGIYLWNADNADNQIYQLDMTGTIVSFFGSPDSSPEGLTFDGVNLWLAGSTDDTIYQIDTLGNVVSSMDAPGLSPKGLAFDGEHLWHNDDYDNLIYQLDTSGNLINSLPSQALWASGLTFDGEYLWELDSFYRKIYKIDTTGNLITAIDTTPGKRPQGLSFDGVYLWHAEEFSEKIYKVIIDPEHDTDGDGTADYDDCCPLDEYKIDPDLCGCGEAETDTDGDGTPDCIDECPQDEHKTAPGDCGCSISDIDTDIDLTPDCSDGCPLDENKIDPGFCGCGELETDTDKDGTPDCIDNCPEDKNKTDAGVCGCGLSDMDSDSDGTPNCNDNCPEDENKTDAGVCGCGLSDMDSDRDGTLDCNDECPNDPNKIAPGNNGCDNPEDEDGSDDGSGSGGGCFVDTLRYQ